MAANAARWLGALVVFTTFTSACFGDGASPDSAPNTDGDEASPSTSLPTTTSAPDGTFNSCVRALGSTEAERPKYGWTLTDLTAAIVDWDDFGNDYQPPVRDGTIRSGVGVNAILRPAISTITLGTEDADPNDREPDDDQLAMIIIEFGPLFIRGTSDGDTCNARITSATVSTTDARVGTASDINGRKYVSLGESENNPIGLLQLRTIGGGLVEGVFEMSLTEEILSPIEAPRYEGSFRFRALFVAEER